MPSIIGLLACSVLSLAPSPEPSSTEAGAEAAPDEVVAPEADAADAEVAQPEPSPAVEPEPEPAPAPEPEAEPPVPELEAEPPASQEVVAEEEPAAVEGPLTPRERRGKAPLSVRWKLLGELGALGVAYHGLQFDSEGTYFDLRRDGRQDTMFLFGRISTELEIDDHHEIVLLYQPLSLRTESVLLDDLVADDVTFTAGTGVEFFYGFDFYRASYAYDIFKDPGDELAFGFGMQVRNFRSSYVSTDGEQAVTNSNIGPVPALKIRGRHVLDRANFWYGAEVDGFYANIPFINGGNDPIEGLILDASLRAGVTLGKRIRPYVNLRYLGGGGKGTSSDKIGYGDGYTNNWLHTVSVSLGAEVSVTVLKGNRAKRDAEVAARKAKRRAKRGR